MPTALLSVYDKSGIVELASALHEAGWTLVSSGGTAAAVAAAGLPVTDVADVTGVPAILDHRVVTLHPRIHGGILADPTKASHQTDMAQYGISAIDLVVVNLYPFESDRRVEQIDIGGPAMVRAAAKNFEHVGVVVDPADYRVVVDEIGRDGSLSAATRRRLAATAFARIAGYDAAIANWFDAPTADEPLPVTMHLSLERVQSLRYGENPHQQGARYRLAGRRSWWDDAEQLGGKELSYLNLFDSEAAWRLVHRFDEPACVIVKHANPCGVAVAADIAEAYRLANECDPVSAFGGIVALNRPATAAMVGALGSVFTEVLIAPEVEPAAQDLLSVKKNLRVLRAPRPSGADLDMRSIDGGLLVQQVDAVEDPSEQWQVVTSIRPSPGQWPDLVFAWQVCAAVSSNAIVLAKDGQAVGVGAGQQNRVDSARIAAGRAAGRAVGGVCASDAFFPFRDTLDVVADAGVTAIIQPGGSMRDDESIAAADERGIAMVFTGRRHFRH